MDVFYRPIAFAAMLGFAGSLTWHLFALRGVEFPHAVANGLFIGIFVVFFPTVLYLQRFQRMFRSGADLGTWKHIVRGAPVWMIIVAVTSFFYAAINFFLATGAATGSVAEKDPSWDRVGSGHSMVFYSLAMLVMYAAAERGDDDREPLCERGHAMPIGAAFCERCGAPARKQPLRAGD